MTRVHKGASLFIIAFSAWVMWQSFQMNYYTELGPGPGFFPFWLAVIMAGLSAIWFGQLVTSPLQGKASDFVPSRAALVRIFSLIMAVAIFGLFMEATGFSVMMFAVLAFLLVALGRQNAYITLVISILGSFGMYYVFSNYLNVHLPDSFIPFLQALGF